MDTVWFVAILAISGLCFIGLTLVGYALIDEVRRERAREWYRDDHRPPPRS